MPIVQIVNYQEKIVPQLGANAITYFICTALISGRGQKMSVQCAVNLGSIAKIVDSLIVVYKKTDFFLRPSSNLSSDPKISWITTTTRTINNGVYRILLHTIISPWLS